MEVLETLNNYFWDERFWLPGNVTWDDLRSDEHTFIPSFSDMWVPLPIAVGLFLLRLLWQRLIAFPIGRYFQLPDKPPKAQSVDLLEKTYTESRRVPKKHILTGLAKQLDWSERKIERWWRVRRAQEKPSDLQKFGETSWRCLFYASLFFVGLYLLWDKPWFWDTKECWKGWPRQNVNNQIYWYYMIELGFYYSLIISLYMDVKRKDHNMNLVHHASTIGLMVFSWTCNFARVGSLVLILHDIVDPIMEFARVMQYIKYLKVSDALFVLFALMWFASRVFYMPYWILNTTLYESISILEFCLCYLLFNLLLLILQVLHIIWSIMILRIAKELMFEGKCTDIDSDAELDIGAEEMDKEVVSNGTFKMYQKYVMNGIPEGTDTSKMNGFQDPNQNKKIN